MKMAYMQLYDLNKEVIRGYEIRRNNHLELLECLKIVNQAVQKATRLRGINYILLPLCMFSYYVVGKYKTLCTTSCRNAIKEMNHENLIKAILTGS